MDDIGSWWPELLSFNWIDWWPSPSSAGIETTGGMWFLSGHHHHRSSVSHELRSMAVIVVVVVVVYWQCAWHCWSSLLQRRVIPRVVITTIVHQSALGWDWWSSSKSAASVCVAGRCLHWIDDSSVVFLIIVYCQRWADLLFSTASLASES